MWPAGGGRDHVIKVQELHTYRDLRLHIVNDDVYVIYGTTLKRNFIYHGNILVIFVIKRKITRIHTWHGDRRFSTGTASRHGRTAVRATYLYLIHGCPLITPGHAHSLSIFPRRTTCVRRSERHTTMTRSIAPMPRSRCVPPLHAEVEVCYIDDDDAWEWWAAIVTRIGTVRKKGAVACIGTIVFDIDDEECDVQFLRTSGMLRTKGADGTWEKKNSTWRLKAVGMDNSQFSTGKLSAQADASKVSLLSTAIAGVDEGGRPTTEPSRVPGSGKRKRRARLTQDGSTHTPRTAAEVNRRKSRRATGAMRHGERDAASAQPPVGNADNPGRRRALNDTGDGTHDAGSTITTPPSTSTATRLRTSRSRRGGTSDAGPASRVGQPDGALYVVQSSDGPDSAVKSRLDRLEGELAKSIRVQAKRGICSAILRPPGRIVARGDHASHDGVLQIGVIVWSTKVEIDRFQLFAAKVDQFKEVVRKQQKRTAVRFDPEYDVIKDDAGFGEARMAFASAVDLLQFLGVKRRKDLRTLLWNKFNQHDNYLRVLGAARMIETESHPSLQLFLGQSCTNAALPLHGATPPDSAGRSSGDTSSPCFTYSDARWDTENNCFASEPSLCKRSAGYESCTLEECVAFQITWEVEKMTTPRQLSHVATDTEGVRTGKMEVEIPYFLAGPELEDSLSSLCGESDLNSVISESFSCKEATRDDVIGTE